ncbi:TMEM43 family protein [Rickettsiales bacterium]|nr:TMEM43 family protein [Rickettsiales bacterium]
MTESTVQRTSYSERLSGSIFSMLLGFVGFFASIYLISWNEGRTIKTYVDLQNLKENLVIVSSKQINRNNNNKIIYVSGYANTNNILQDKLFNISVNALKLKREVEMFQWIETKSTKKKENIGGSVDKITTYNYEMQWHDRLVNSQNFKKKDEHKNPESMAFIKRTFSSNPIFIDDYKLGRVFIDQIVKFTPIDLHDDSFYSKDYLNNKNEINEQDVFDDQSDVNPSLAVAENKANDNVKQQNINLNSKFTIEDNYFYNGSNFDNPDIGDIRIKYSVIEPQNLSVIGKQKNTKKIVAGKGDYAKVAFLEYGIVSPEDMIEKQEFFNTLTCWGLRLLGIILIFGCLKAIVSPITILLAFIPAISRIFSFLTGIVFMIISLVVGITTIIISWFAYRPILSISLGVIVLLLIFCIIPIVRKKKKELESNSQPQPVNQQVSQNTVNESAVNNTNIKGNNNNSWDPNQYR